MGDVLPWVVPILAVVTGVAGAVAFLWARSNDDRRDSATAIATVRNELRADITRIHERLDELGKERVDMGDINALRDDMRQVAARVDQLNSNFLKFMTATHAAE